MRKAKKKKIPFEPSTPHPIPPSSLEALAVTGGAHFRYMGCINGFKVFEAQIGR